MSTHEFDEVVASATEEARAASRRGFLGRTAAAAGIVLAGSSAHGASTMRPNANGKRSNQGGGAGDGGVAAERSKGRPGGPGGRPGGTGRVPDLYPGSTARDFQEIRADEDAHVAFLVKALGAAARPKPNFRNLNSFNYPGFIFISQTFENTGVHAYLGALPYISDHGLAGTAGTIATVEARHAGWLNTLVNQPLVPTGAFDTPFTQQQVIDGITPFVQDLNGGPPLAFSTDPSQLGPMNDIAILNFALALEFLEREFYDINVPIFYP